VALQLDALLKWGSDTSLLSQAFVDCAEFLCKASEARFSARTTIGYDIFSRDKLVAPQDEIESTLGRPLFAMATVAIAAEYFARRCGQFIGGRVGRKCRSGVRNFAQHGSRAKRQGTNNGIAMSVSHRAIQ
jgi:hypothetical protein